VRRQKPLAADLASWDWGVILGVILLELEYSVVPPQPCVGSRRIACTRRSPPLACLPADLLCPP
jgi:hypothetical protein